MAKRSTAIEYHAHFLQTEKWWVAWTGDVPGALTQGKTIEEAGENLKDAIRLMLEPADLETLTDHSDRLRHDVINL